VQTDEASLNPILPLESSIGSTWTTSHLLYGEQKKKHRQWQRNTCVWARGVCREPSGKRQVYLWGTSYSRPLSGGKCTATNIPENLNHKTIIRCWVKDTLRGRISFSSWRLRGCRCSEGGCLGRNTIENTQTEIACHQHGGRNVPRGRPCSKEDWFCFSKIRDQN